MMTNIEIIHLLRARVTRDGTICAKIAYLAILMEPTPLLEKVLAAVSYPNYGS